MVNGSVGEGVEYIVYGVCCWDVIVVSFFCNLVCRLFCLVMIVNVCWRNVKVIGLLVVNFVWCVGGVVIINGLVVLGYFY